MTGVVLFPISKNEEEDDLAPNPLLLLEVGEPVTVDERGKKANVGIVQ